MPVHSQNAVGFDPAAGMQDVAASQDTIREIAMETGGRTYVKQNDIKSGVADALADSSATYTFGYYPENKTWDNNYRTTKVKLTPPDFQVHHRRGYYAFDPTQVKDSQADQEVSEALRASIPATLVIFSTRAKTKEPVTKPPQTWSGHLSD